MVSRWGAPPPLDGRTITLSRKREKPLCREAKAEVEKLKSRPTAFAFEANNAEQALAAAAVEVEQKAAELCKLEEIAMAEDNQFRFGRRVYNRLWLKLNALLK